MGNRGSSGSHCFSRAEGSDPASGAGVFPVASPRGSGQESASLEGALVTAKYLAQSHKTQLEAVRGLLDLTAGACGGDVRFYSSPGGRGRSVITADESDVERASFKLVARSQVSSTRGGMNAVDGDDDVDRPAPSRHVPFLDAALKNQPQSQQVDGIRVAASTVRTSLGTEGVLLVELESFDGASTNSPALEQLVYLWSFVLAERLERIQLFHEKESLKKACEATLLTLEAHEVTLGDANVVTNLIPPKVLRGGVQSDRLALWFYDGDAQELVLNNSGHYDGFRVPVDNSIVGDAVRHGGNNVICVRDVYTDSRFNSSVDEKTGFRTQSTICVPIERAQEGRRRTKSKQDGARANSKEASPKKVTGQIKPDWLTVVQFTNGRDGHDDASVAHHFDFVNAEALRDSVLPTMLQIRDSILRLIATERQRDGMKAVVSKLAQADSVTEVTEVVKSDFLDVMGCEKCSLFFIDDAQNEIWAPPTEGLPNGICLGMGEGVVGHVAAMAKEGIHGKCILIANDPPACPYWKGDVQEGFTTRNIITAPVWSSGKDPRLLGVIQILNKKLGRSSQDDDDEDEIVGWARADEKLLELLAQGVGDHLQRLMLDMMCTKARMDGGREDAEGKGMAAGLLSEYYMESTASLQKTEAMESRAVDAIGVGRGLSKELFSSFNDTDPVEYGDVREWRVDYWKLSDEEQFRLFWDGLCTVSDAKEMGVSQQTLGAFFGEIRGAYNDAPYHNFYHALAVVHYASKYILAADVLNQMRDTDRFAVIVAALCHDCDHRGRNNAFEVSARSDLALRYNDSSPLENHHCARAFEVALRSKSEAGDGCNIFRQMSSQCYVDIRKAMVAGILSTDMKHHGDHIKALQTFQLQPGVDPAQSQHLVELMLHSADISNPLMPTDISKIWVECIFKEFSEQVSAERELGIPVTTFMDGLQEPTAAAKNQLGFIDFVITPMFDPIFKLWPGNNSNIPGFAEPQGFLAANRLHFANILDEKVAGRRSVMTAKPSITSNATTSGEKQEQDAADGKAED